MASGLPQAAGEGGPLCSKGPRGEENSSPEALIVLK